MKTEYANNIIIANFMNVELWIDDGSLKVYKFPNGELHGLGALEYHKSWDWIKPVLNKIKALSIGMPDELSHLNLFSEITEVNDAVINFIKKRGNGKSK